MGGQGLYTHTVSYERDPGCPICSAGVAVEVEREATLQEVRPMPPLLCLYAFFSIWKRGDVWWIE